MRPPRLLSVVVLCRIYSPTGSEGLGLCLFFTSVMAACNLSLAAEGASFQLNPKPYDKT